MMKVKYYKCPICNKKFKTLNGWGSHVNESHPGTRPEDYSISRYFYFTMTGKTHGVCRTCKKDTPWNDETMKYDQYCTNPECKKAYAKIAKTRMIDKYGKAHLLNDPNIQKKMLSNRKISGKYKFDDGTEFQYVGSYEKEFLHMLNSLFRWHSNDLMAPSPHIYYYDYKNPKDDPKNEGQKFYIPDFYIPSLNLEIEIKQQTSGNQAMNAISRVKEKLKDEIMDNNKSINYLKINDNDFTSFFEFLMKAKENIPTKNELNKNIIGEVVESYINGIDFEKLDSLSEFISNNEMTIANEGLISLFGFGKNIKLNPIISWKDFAELPKNLVGDNEFSNVSIKDGNIIIKGINYRLLQLRIQRFYKDKSIYNIFLPNYNALSYRKFEKKQINRKSIKIDYLYTSEFFALELVCLFNELGKRYRDKVYKNMARQIYTNSWLSKADYTSENIPYLKLDNLNNLRLQLNVYQKEFIAKYPKLKAQLNLNGYILAFEQGLGKTLTSVALSECLNVDHVYIICPNSLKENWALEIKKYYDKYDDDNIWRDEVFICTTNKKYFNHDKVRFIITNNESIEKMYPYILKGNNMLVVDESHNFRNIKSKRSGQLVELKNKLNCNDVLVMSGTPIKATPDEIVPALLLIDPTFTDSAAECFSKAFKLHSSLGTSLVKTRFGKIIYRKEKDVLENPLPEKNISSLSVKISNGDKYTMTNVNKLVMQRFNFLYDTGISDSLKLRYPFFELNEKYAENKKDVKKFESLIDTMTKKFQNLHEIDQIFVETYMKNTLSRISNSSERDKYKFMVSNFVRFKPHCLGVAFGEILPKFRRDMFIEMYKENASTIYNMIQNNVKKTLIFSQFKDVVNYIVDDLNDHGIGAVSITGSVKDRMGVLRSFKEDNEIMVLIATSQTIGTGVTLVEANQMFFFGPPWRQSDFDQCSDRIHRIGQTDDVNVYTVVLDTGSELNLSTRMDDILLWSKNMTEAVISKTDIAKNDEELENIMKATESYVLPNNTLKHRVDEFKSGKSNIILITGLSGSGKTTMAKNICKQYNAEFIELDCFEQNYGMTDEQLKECGEPFYLYLTRTSIGREFRQKSLSNNKPTGEELVKSIKLFGKWLLKWCSTKTNKKYAIEGVQIYSCFDLNDIKKYPIIINGVSMVNSIYRRTKREGYEKEFIKMCKWYLQEEKILSKFKKEIANEVYSNLNVDKELLDEFISAKSNTEFNL